MGDRQTKRQWEVGMERLKLPSNDTLPILPLYVLIDIRYTQALNLNQTTQSQNPQLQITAESILHFLLSEVQVQVISGIRN